MMRSIFKKPIFVIVVVLVVFGVFLFVGLNKKQPIPVPVETPKSLVDYKIIGTSVEGRKIEAYTYGSGEKHLLFVGGMHGGYEWNSVLLAYKFIDYLDGNPDFVPADLTVTIIPSANPDGVFAVTGKEGRFTAEDVSIDKKVLMLGRFNSHEVDLNRNFDCKWKSTSTWQARTVNAGTEAFSEPETAAIRDFVLKNNPVAAVFFHSQSNAVYASECKDGILPETLGIMNAYSKAAGYPAVKTFDAYAVTGDAEGWLASIEIPAITVELKTHDTVEWDKNFAGIKALFEYYKFN